MDVPFPPFVQDLQIFSEAMQTSKVWKTYIGKPLKSYKIASFVTTVNGFQVSIRGICCTFSRMQRGIYFFFKINIIFTK